MTLWQPDPDDLTHVRTVRALSTHLLSRARFAATGRIGLVPTPGGLGTPVFGPEVTRVRLSGATLVHERVGGDRSSTQTIGVNGRSWGELAEFVGVELDPSFRVGEDTAVLPPPEEIVHLDDLAARRVGGWFGFVDSVLVHLLADRPNSTASATQIWPEHFDLAVQLDAAVGGPRVNVGGSPGDDFSPEPYLYVGPHTIDRPGDAGYWNAPFGAALGLGQLAEAEHPDSVAVQFLHRGLDLLAAR